MARASPLKARARFMATVEGSTSRQMPQPTTRATPVSKERALFTIKVRTRFPFSPLAESCRLLTPNEGWAHVHWPLVRCKDQHLGRSGLHHLPGRLPRVPDRPFLPRPDPGLHPAAHRQLRRARTKAPFHVASPHGDMHVAVIDCGVKENILRSLVSRGAHITVFPYNYPIHKIADHFDGVFISNGPGDPTHCQETIYHLRRLMDSSQMPVFGICLGHQLLSLASGATTSKLKYGNRAHNIPALDLTTGKCHITSQNHGYQVDAKTLPDEWKEYFVNLNDGSNEGMIHKTRPIFSTQFHPEAKGGPTDSSYLFDSYMDAVRTYHKTQQQLKPNRDSKPTPLLQDLLGKERVGVETDFLKFGQQAAAAAA
ncbi:hypothetical protein FH972_026708 [Carpinus fangiana]|uniref:carbamoyl-phosphate synthase (glutamine-hydrolyzing) n=1 Tax=Carpinus fangiana TaxID=176857 RepID=A0A5N6L576_9ROSI|nr:hypothetical protein FH972_026708 [Carpinus fangiana]